MWDADRAAALLRDYFEPSADDRDEGTKQPTAAHKAIAALAAMGFIRVILTTNFDRLIETALEDAGLKPAVLTTPDQLQGALPLIHTRCCVIKLHGDYLDTRIRNTQAELASYPAEFNRLLGVCATERLWDLVVEYCSRPVPQEGQAVGTSVVF